MDGVMPMDYDIAEMLRKSGKDVVVIANKIDDERNERFAYVFKIFGFGDPIIASAEHGIGEDKILNVINERTRDFIANHEAENLFADTIKVAFIGRPNVGKSSTVNALLNENRIIVSGVPGTTRDEV